MPYNIIPAHDDLLAVVGPGLVHLLHEDELVLALADELLDRGLHVLLHQLLDSGKYKVTYSK